MGVNNEILKKYNIPSVEEFEGREGIWANMVLEMTDHIPLKIIEGFLASTDCIDELEAREYARMILAESSGEEYTPKASKNIEERTTEAEMVSTAMLGTETNKDQASEQLRRALQMFAQTVTDDAQALSIKSVYPNWKEIIGMEVKEGFKFRYGDDLFKIIQPTLTIQEHYIPNQGTESLYTKIDETHAGTVEDPIPYDGNMEIFSGKYYIQNEVIYECIRDSGTPLYHSLADLVGVYVKVYATE